MKVVILAGGFGSRISEESHLTPKPMIAIGEQPILWHIMKIYSYYGFNEFIICLGYKAHIIKEFFNDYFLHTSDVTIDLTTNEIIVHNNYSEPWKITLVDTGLRTMTGGRVKRIRKYIGDEDFMLTYGDGISNVDIRALRAFHERHGKAGTITAVNAGQRFGILSIDSGRCVNAFREKSDSDGALVNGGFMVFKPEIFDRIEGDDTIFEKEPLQSLVDDNELMAFKHEDFWQCMDTQRDKKYLEELWNGEKAPWKIW